MSIAPNETCFFGYSGNWTQGMRTRHLPPFQLLFFSDNFCFRTDLETPLTNWFSLCRRMHIPKGLLLIGAAILIVNRVLPHDVLPRESRPLPRLAGPVSVHWGQSNPVDFFFWHDLRIFDNVSKLMSTPRTIFVFRKPVP
jgi:hypothetical protein